MQNRLKPAKSNRLKKKRFRNEHDHQSWRDLQFLQDDEPTDEQLQVIMQEVAEEARRESNEIAKNLLQNIERESLLALAAQQAQSK